MRGLVDRKARNKLAQALRQFASGRTTNEEFEEVIGFPMTSKDRGVRAVQYHAYCLYDDFHDYKLAGKLALIQEERHEIARWILFLQTDLEYEWPRFMPSSSSLIYLLRLIRLGPPTTHKDIWPFVRPADLENALEHPRLLSGKAQQAR